MLTRRSWHRYEEEKNHPPRVFNFQTISDHDVLTRTLNEIHKCVLPKVKEFRLFKTPEEIAASSNIPASSADIEVKDPRKNPTRFLKLSHELIRNYGYSSDLTAAEQSAVITSMTPRIMHNPKLLKFYPQRKHKHQQQQLTPEISEKHKTELAHFNKCAEIHFYRHVSELNYLVNDDMKTFLIQRWSKLQSNDEERKFQVITMLLRDQLYDGKPQVDLISTADGNFNREAYVIADDKFPSLERFTAEDLKFYRNLDALRAVEMDSEVECDVALSVDLLAKLFIDTEEFSVRFEKVQHSSGRLLSSFNEAVPSKPVSISKILEEIVETSLMMSFDLDNINRWSSEKVETDEKVDHYQAKQIEDVMTEIFTKYRSRHGLNASSRIWKLSDKLQNFSMLVRQSNVFSVKLDDSLEDANISVKLEFQTKFGAEKMTKNELLGEWCSMKFASQSCTLRFRVDAITLKILSITKVSFTEVEKELSDVHTTEPEKLVGNLMNVFSCIQRLPQGDYLIQTKLESDCKKLFIHKTSENGKLLTSEPWDISSISSRKWLPIDGLTPTFIHINHHFPPGCFPLGNKKRPSACIQKPATANKNPKLSPKKSKSRIIRKKPSKRIQLNKNKLKKK